MKLWNTCNEVVGVVSTGLVIVTIAILSTRSLQANINNTRFINVIMVLYFILFIIDIYILMTRQRIKIKQNTCV